MTIKTSSIYLIVGDTFLAEERFKSLQTQFAEEIKQIQTVLYRLSETPIDTILADARTLPFLTDLQIFRIFQSDLLKEKSSEMLSQYFDLPHEKTVLVFEAETLDKSHPLISLAQKKGEVYWLDEKQKRTQAAKFIQEKLKSYGKTITRPALERLELQMGDAPMFLHSVVEQMANYVSGSQIDEEVVEKFEEKWQETDIFQLANALAEKRTGRALSLLKQIAPDKNADILSLVGFFHWQFKRFWQAAYLFEKGFPQDLILKDCKVYGKQAPFFLRQLRLFPKSKLEAILEGLFQLDWKIKTGQTAADAGMELWVIETTQDNHR